MGREQTAAILDAPWLTDEDAPPTLRLVDGMAARAQLPSSVRAGRFGDPWIGPRIALDARVALLADTLGRMDDRGRLYRLARLLGGLRDVVVALDALVETADASPEIAGPLAAALGRYVDSVYASCMCGAAAIDELAVRDACAEGPALTSSRFRHDLARSHAALETARLAHDSKAAWRIAVQATGLQAELARLNADLRSEAA